ncbi:L,D-transpeptidase family protein [Echinicola marina]|uniref:L,D-transpeptidase family protein n=1 Tax=Echinicola marina TaxID=2859768 RepID=UPI001CF651AF|nr:L,D-transpeptidase family protein [Echinicola marina]UCS95434.1 L,D-transpeptidase family protein [Echinicola marina]
MNKVIFAFAISFLFILNSVYAQSKETDVSGEIRNLLESSSLGELSHGAIGNFSQYDLLIKFYSNRGFQAAWTSGGRLSSQAVALRDQVEASLYDGLLPSDYYLEQIDDIIQHFEIEQMGENSLQLAYIDLIFSESYLKMATDLYKGKIPQEAIKTGWQIQAKKVKVKFEEVLESAIQGDTIGQSIKTFWPDYKVYANIRESLRDYYEMASSSEERVAKLTYKKLIKLGDSNRLIPEIRSRLVGGESGGDDLYDSALMKEVLKVQKRFGLNADGIIGPETVRALNETPADMIRRIAVNLERLRWLPDTVIEDRFIMVNIANYQLDYVQSNGLDTLFSSKVIVGKQYRSTPVFNGEMSYIVFSPTWTVPASIVRGEMIPKIKKDAGYLSSNHMQILTYSGKEVDPASLDWSEVSSKNFPYMVRQLPGPHNSLGLVKFIFPNKFNVYIHDTPVKSLFDKDIRAFSHGCIRLQKPEAFAEIVLQDNSLWDKEKIFEAMHSGKETTVMLKKKIPVVILYLTFWRDASGKDYIRKDIYDRDEAIAEALFH